MDHELARCLNKQQKALDISVSEIARWAKVSRATVSRILRGDIGHCNFASIMAVCEVLGIDFGEFRVKRGAERISEVASEKAERLARLAQGNCSLENQTISSDAFTDTVERIKLSLLSGSRRRLWAR